MKVEEKCDLRRATYMKMLLITRGLLGNMFFFVKYLKYADIWKMTEYLTVCNHYLRIYLTICF